MRVSMDKNEENEKLQVKIGLLYASFCGQNEENEEVDQ